MSPLIREKSINSQIGESRRIGIMTLDSVDKTLNVFLLKLWKIKSIETGADNRAEVNFTS